MEEKDYALISDRELVDRLLIGDEEDCPLFVF